jgi:putative flippase GtrA
MYKLIKKLLNNQKIRFLIVGGLNTLVSFILFAIFDQIFKNIKNGYILALSFSWIIAVIFAFFMQRNFVFTSKGQKTKEFIKFVALNIAMYFINLGILSLLIQNFNLNHLIAQLIALVVTTLISFFGNKYFTFK